MKFCASSLIAALLVGCAGAPKTRPHGSEDVEAWLSKQEQISWDHLQKNISPVEPKSPGGPTPMKGIVVGALHKKDPDYYFHWVRDSANVMRIVAEAARVQRPYADPKRVQEQFRDFLRLSKHLQSLPAPYGLGEPRYTVEGEVDTLPWSRPQYDGPALRALAVLEFLRMNPAKADRELALQVLRTDLDFLTGVWDKRGFDLWEELKAENYHTRLVQLAAFEESARWFEANQTDPRRAAQLRKIAKELERRLDDHWDPARGFLRSQLVIEATDGYTQKKTDLDSAVVVAVMEAGRGYHGHSVMDDRVHATVAVLEDLFRSEYPINKEPGLGLGYGRYLNDHYYGGNPWFLITAYYAQFYSRLARALGQGQDFQITKRNAAFVHDLLPEVSPNEFKEPVILKAGSAAHQRLRAACLTKADRILARIEHHTPSDGQLWEQFDKNSGMPASSRGIGWSHSSLLAAAMERSLSLSVQPLQTVPPK